MNDLKSKHVITCNELITLKRKFEPKSPQVETASKKQKTPSPEAAKPTIAEIVKKTPPAAKKRGGTGAGGSGFATDEGKTQI